MLVRILYSFYLKYQPVEASIVFFLSHKKVICNIDVVTEESNGTTAATEIKKRHNMVNLRSFKPI